MENEAIYKNNDGNEIIYNNTYYYMIPIFFSKTCGLGHYYDTTKYIISLLRFPNINIISSLICIECPMDQYKEYDMHSDSCKHCPDGARCLHGLLYNLAG